MTDLAALFGGLGLFLLGMQLMTDGLKAAAGDALRVFLERSTKTKLRALGAGLFVTGLVQSSSAVTVAVIGFAAAGLLSLNRAIVVVFGTNVGTTMTGWLVALIGVKVDIGALALPLIGAGMGLRLLARRQERWSAAGDAIAGFGAFFLGIGVLQAAFAGLAPALALKEAEGLGLVAVPAFVLAGALLTVLTQSSSAAVAITLTASAGAALPLPLAAAAVIGTNIGTTSTAAFAAIGAGAPARRVAAAHILFNLGTGVIALLLLPLLVQFSHAIAAPLPGDDDTATLAFFHTLFNVLGVVIAFPFADRLGRRLERLFATPDEALAAPRHLDRALAAVPALALSGLVLETLRLMRAACALGAATLGEVPPDRAKIASHHAPLLRLGAAVREFIGVLTHQKLPQDVVAAIPDVVRAVQHAEEIARTSMENGAPLDRRGRAPQPAELEGAWRRLDEAAREALDYADFELPSRPDIGAIETEVEGAYQALKAALLGAAARGAVTISAMESSLREAQRRRKLAVAAIKAKRRMTGWLKTVAPPADAQSISRDEPS